MQLVQLMAKLTRLQLAGKACNLRKAYAAGRLSKVYIKIIEDDLPGWDWSFPNIEVQDLERTKGVAKFYHKHDRYPHQGAKGTEEKKLGIWIRNKRAARQGKGNGVFYPSCERLANQLGCPDMFHNIDLEARALDRTKMVAKFYHKHDRYPSNSARDADEKRLAQWLSSQRQAKHENGGATFYPSCERLAKQLGCPDMFNNIDLEAQALERTKRVAKFYYKHGRYPSSHSKNKEGKKLGSWLSNMRQAKQGKGRAAFYSSCEQLAKQLGCPDMFEYIDYESKALEMTRKVVEFYHKHDRYPSKHAKDPEEKNLGRWLPKQREAKQGKGKGVFYPSCEKLAKQLGCPNMFEQITIKTREVKALEVTRKVAKFYRKHGRYPSTIAKYPEEKKLGNWLSNMRQAKQGKDGMNTFYPSCKKLAKELGCPDMFKVRSRRTGSSDG